MFVGDCTKVSRRFAFPASVHSAVVQDQTSLDRSRPSLLFQKGTSDYYLTDVRHIDTDKNA